MKLEDYKLIFAAIGLIGVLILTSPTLGLMLHPPNGEKFSEFWVLGSGHMLEDYPFNVTAGMNNSVYVDVDNNIGTPAYYVVYVKFRNEAESFLNVTSGTPSNLAPLYEYRVFLEDNKSSEFLLTFSFSDISFSKNQSTIGSLTINGVQFNLGKSASWDTVNHGYYYQLFMELWIYDPASKGFSYDNRFVSLWLNVTASV